MGWEQAKDRMVGDNGEERAGRASYGEAMYGQGNAAERQSAERDYVTGLHETQREAEAAKLRQKIAAMGEELAAIEASIEAIVAQIQQGERVANETRSAAAKEINANLAAEAQAQKLALLTRKTRLLLQKASLESKLEEL